MPDPSINVHYRGIRSLEAKHLVLITEANSVLGLVEDGLTGTAVRVLILGAADLM